MCTTSNVNVSDPPKQGFVFFVEGFWNNCHKSFPLLPLGHCSWGLRSESFCGRLHLAREEEKKDQKRRGDKNDGGPKVT